MNFLPVRKFPESPPAPLMSVSSSVVKSNSRGGCESPGASATANAVATPMPSSAPSVVSLACSQSPSRTKTIGSVVKSWGDEGFFWHTMSVCACKTTIARFS